MIKLILLTAALSLTQAAVANTVKEKEAVKPAIDMTAANKAHAAINEDKKDQPFWSEKQKKQAEMETKYKEAIAKNPDDKENYKFLAGLYLTNNKTLKAIHAYQDAITHDSENPKLFAAISIAYLHQSKYNMAKSMADEALRLNPKMEGVGKINEYVEAKLAAIEEASKAPAPASSKIDMTKGAGLHGTLAPAEGVKPSDKIHTPK